MNNNTIITSLKTASGNNAKNQYAIYDNENDTILFKSYHSNIVEIDFANKVITYFPHWDYSATTNKYRNWFMRDNLGVMASKADFLKAINNGYVGEFTVKAA